MAWYREICDSQIEKLATENNPFGFVACLSSLNFFLSGTAFFGNLLIVIALLKSSSIHAPSKALLISLALTDLGVGLFSQPLFATSKVLGYREQYDLAICIIAIFDTFIGDALAAVSLLTVTVISIDRYLAFRLRGKYRDVVTLKRIILAIISCWLTTYLWIGLKFWEERASQVLQTTFVCFCLIATPVSYAKVYTGLSSYYAHIQDRRAPSERRNRERPVNMARYKRSVVTMAYICGFLVTCYLPHFILEAVADAFSDEQLYLRLKNCTKTVAYFSSSINPFIYCWRVQAIYDSVCSTLSYFRRCLLRGGKGRPAAKKAKGHPRFS